jgi:hypothetical protein
MAPVRRALALRVGITGSILSERVALPPRNNQKGMSRVKGANRRENRKWGMSNCCINGL